MFHLRLLELESELLAKEQAKEDFKVLPVECLMVLELTEEQVGVRLASQVPHNWRGWLCWRRDQNSLIICRGRAFSTGSIFGKCKAGFDVPYGVDAITEYERGFDVTPPQELDHLLLNFGVPANPRVFLWYGENLAEYKLVFASDVTDELHHELSDAVVEACVWILTRPKEKTLLEFLKQSNRIRPPEGKPL